MAKRSKPNNNKEEKDFSPQDAALLRALNRTLKLQELQRQCDNFSIGMRVYKQVLCNQAVNPLLLYKGIKRGIIADKCIGIPSGYPTILVLWDGDSVPVPEPPCFLKEDW